MNIILFSIFVRIMALFIYIRNKQKNLFYLFEEFFNSIISSRKLLHQL